MTLLLENPLPIWAVGVVLTAVCILVLLVRRTSGALLALVGVVVATLLLAWIESVVVTDREEVEQAVAELMQAIEANDLDAVLAHIDPQAPAVRSDAETLMPQVRVRDTGATALTVELSGEGEATARFRGRIDGVLERSGQRYLYFDDVEIHWTRKGDAWLVSSYTAQWRGREIDAVESLRGNRAVRPSR